MKNAWNTRILALISAAALTGLLSACASTPNVGGQSARSELDTRVQSAINDFKVRDPSMQDLLTSAYGYAVFPGVVSGAIGIGGGHGNGEVFQNGQFVGYADLSQGSVGLQLGGERAAEIIFFENKGSLADLKDGTLQFDARASAVAASKGAAATANYEHGTVVFTLPEGGLMARAAIGGQKFRYEPATEEANER